MIPKHRPGPLGKSCLTCKERHKKCDKRQPICERCEAGQFECLGYGHNSRARTSIIRPPKNSDSSSSRFEYENPLNDASISGTRIGDIPTASSPLELLTDPDLNTGTTDQGHVPNTGDTPTLTTPQKGRVEDYLYLFATRSTFKPTDSPMSILCKIVDLQTRLPLSPSDPLKTFLNSQWFVDYILTQSDRVTDDWYFKPTNYKRNPVREDTILRLQTSEFNRWIALVGIGVIEFFLTGDMSQSSLHSFWLDHIEGSLRRELMRDLTPCETQGRHNDWIQISLMRIFVAHSSNVYQMLRSITPVFLQVVYSNPTLWPNHCNFRSVPLSTVLTSETPKLALFALLDCNWAAALGIPQQIDYDTTFYSRPNSSPLQWAYGSPIEFQLVLADINACRDKSPTARDWRDIEQRLLTWQSCSAENIFTESWMTIAWYAVQETCRLAMLAYLYLAVCDTPSDDPRIQSCIKQILQVIGTVKKQGSSDANVSFFIQYLIVGICARGEAHRQVVRNKLLAPKGTKIWLMRGPDFVPVLDHLWHGTAAGGRPIKWSDYMRSRAVVLPVI